MTYWTVLWITVLGGPLDGSTSGLIYPDLATCEASIAAVVGTLDGAYGLNVICEETSTPSGSIRPQPRPENLGTN